MFRSVIVFLLTLSSLGTSAITTKFSPLGNPNAPQGGQITIGISGYPKHLLFYLGFDEFASGINSLVFESLLDSHLDTNDIIPGIAENLIISDDKKTFTFVLNKNAKFSDGKPVTAHDVKFTWDTIMNPKNKTVPFQSHYASFESCEVVDAHTVRFKAKNLHFKNELKVAGLVILPKHFYSNGDFNKSFHNKLVGSGPYVLESAKTNDRIVLKKNPNYWGAKLTQNVGRFNFDKIIFRTVNDPKVMHELFKKGELDYFYYLSSKMWSTETQDGPFAQNYIAKIKAENKIQFGTQGFVWNMRRPLFQDTRVRLALAYLMNRERWISELFYNNYVLATGPVASNSEFHSPSNKPIPFDPKKASQLLAEAGWKLGSDGYLVKDGKRFEFEMLTDGPGSERYLTRYQEDLKRAGIKMNIRMTDWATSIRLVDDWQFDAKEQARGRDTEPSDFAVQWGSAEAQRKGSANSSGYQNPEVDKLAKEIDETFDRKKRVELVRRLDELIGRDQPMAMTWEAIFFRLGHWNRFSFPNASGYFNYSNWMSTFHYWWFDKDKSEKLKKAMASKQKFS